MKNKIIACLMMAPFLAFLALILGIIIWLLVKNPFLLIVIAVSMTIPISIISFFLGFDWFYKEEEIKDEK